LWTTLFLLMGVAWGTASKWDELAIVGTAVTGFMGFG
jgi:hypothetical protein